MTAVQLSVTCKMSDAAPNPAGTDPISTEVSGEMGKNHGMPGWFGKGLKDHPVPHPAMDRDTQAAPNPSNLAKG